MEKFTSETNDLSKIT